MQYHWVRFVVPDYDCSMPCQFCKKHMEMIRKAEGQL